MTENKKIQNLGRGSLESQDCCFVALGRRLARKRVINRQLDHSGVKEFSEGKSVHLKSSSYLCFLCAWEPRGQLNLWLKVQAQ